MNITSLIRAELTAVEERIEGCRKAQLATMLRLGTTLQAGPRGLTLAGSVDSADVARLIRREVMDLYGVTVNVLVRGRNAYELNVAERGVNLAEAAGLCARQPAGRPVARWAATGTPTLAAAPRMVVGLPLSVIGGNPSEVAAALRGAFLVAGSIQTRSRKPVLEIHCPSLEAASSLRGCATRIGVYSTINEREEGVLVVNDVASIETLLKKMGTQRSLEEFLRIRTRQRMTPSGNLFNANARRTSTAAVSTCEQVERALAILGGDAPQNLLEAGHLRLKHREASLSELGRYATPERSKDTVSGQLRRLLQLAEKREAEQSELVGAGTAA